MLKVSKLKKVTTTNSTVTVITRYKDMFFQHRCMFTMNKYCMRHSFQRNKKKMITITDKKPQ